MAEGKIFESQLVNVSTPQYLRGIGTDGRSVKVPVSSFVKRDDLDQSVRAVNEKLGNVTSLEFDSANGAIIINGERFSLVRNTDVTYYNIVKNTSNCSLSGPERVAEGSNFTGTITANNGYVLPQGISVSGSSSYSYNASTGVVTIINVRNNITVTATGVAKPVDTFDYYVGQVDGSKSVFAAMTANDLVANSAKQTSSLVNTTNVNKWIYFFMIPSGYNFASLEFTDGGIKTTVTDLADFTTTHDDVTIGGKVYKVYGYRVSPNALDYKLVLTK